MKKYTALTCMIGAMSIGTAYADALVESLVFTDNGGTIDVTVTFETDSTLDIKDATPWSATTMYLRPAVETDWVTTSKVWNSNFTGDFTLGGQSAKAVDLGNSATGYDTLTLRFNEDLSDGDVVGGSVLTGTFDASYITMEEVAGTEFQLTWGNYTPGSYGAAQGDTVTATTAIPEPSVMAFMGVFSCGLFAVRRIFMI